MKNSVRMTVVAAIALILGCGPKVQLTFQKPSEVNMTDYPRIAVGEIKGRKSTAKKVAKYTAIGVGGRPLFRCVFKPSRLLN